MRTGRHRFTALAATIAATLIAACSIAHAAEDPLVAEVRARDEAAAKALGTGDLATYRASLSKDYVYIDIGGRRVTADVLQERRENDHRRVVESHASEDEAVKIGQDAVLLRGLETGMATYYGGLPRKGESRWSALWVREADGVIRLVAETSTPVKKTEVDPFDAVPQPADVLAAHAGRWAIATDPPLVLNLEAKDGALIGRLDGQTVTWTFAPVGATHFRAKERPFELRFDAGGDALTLVTWGTPTAGKRLAAAD